jgi:hypothetical protein
MPLKAFRRLAFLQQVEENLRHLDELRPLVVEPDKIEQFAHLYMRAFIAKLVLTR